MASRAACVQRDIRNQRKRDQPHPIDWQQWEARTAAVVAARKALVEGEYGAPYALRQAMIDLAACAEHMAGKLPVPTVKLV